MPFKLQVATERRPKVAAPLPYASAVLTGFSFRSNSRICKSKVYLILKLGLLFGQDEGHFILELFTN